MLAPVFLVLAVGAVGVLHTLVPDHWAPIALLARRNGWSRRQTARAAFGAGVGHVLSTLAIGLVVWGAGIAFAARFANAIDEASGVALVAFGLWIAVASFREARTAGGGHHTPHRSPPASHVHLHAHAGGVLHVHAHVHEHDAHDAADVDDSSPPMHDHEHRATGATALMLILGSSPMVEGIPAFFAAAPYGPALLAIMSVVFAAATIATYVAVCVYAARHLQGMRVGPLERYGEVLSGALIALVGTAFFFIR